MWAIIECGSKQYQVREGEFIDVEYISNEIGEDIYIDKVYLISKDDEFLVGKDCKGARVLAEVVAHKKGPKIRIIKFKSKKHYHRSHGHRQLYTTLLIKKIELCKNDKNQSFT